VELVVGFVSFVHKRREKTAERGTQPRAERASSAGCALAAVICSAWWPACSNPRCYSSVSAQCYVWTPINCVLFLFGATSNWRKAELSGGRFMSADMVG
jgi:hypothetical protein